MDEYYTKDEVDNLLANLKGEIDKKFIEEDIKIEDVRKNSAITLTYDTKENGCNGGNDNYCKDSVIRVCGNVYYDKNYFSYSFTPVSIIKNITLIVSFSDILYLHVIITGCNFLFTFRTNIFFETSTSTIFWNKTLCSFRIIPSLMADRTNSCAFINPSRVYDITYRSCILSVTINFHCHN